MTTLHEVISSAISCWGFIQRNPSLSEDERAAAKRCQAKARTVSDKARAAPIALKVCQIICNRMYDESVGRTAVELAKEALDVSEGAGISASTREILGE